VIAAGAFQVMVGTLLEPAAVIVIWADAFKFCGVTVADAGDVPAGLAST
jgi:hypothetical protein